MNRTAKIGASAFVVGLLCLPVIYLVASQYWMKRTAVILPQPQEKEVMWTGIISTTNGWEFKLGNVLDFGRREARRIEFCKKSRQLFIAFGDKQDDALYQWDVDKRECVNTFHVGKGFHPYNYAVSPEGKHLIVERLDALEQNWETLIFDVEKGTMVRELGDIGCWSWEVRFSADGGTAWVDATSLQNWDRGVAFRLDGS